MLLVLGVKMLWDNLVHTVGTLSGGGGRKNIRCENIVPGVLYL